MKIETNDNSHPTKYIIPNHGLGFVVRVVKAKEDKGSP
jgi:hypothetical protein